jgi:hypothetical protein
MEDAVSTLAVDESYDLDTLSRKAVGRSRWIGYGAMGCT